MHPRLFHSLALIEPIIREDAPSGPNAAYFSTGRQGIWPSRREAEAYFRRNKAFSLWDARALDKFLWYGLRETPTLLYPTKTSEPKSVTLTTTKHQEVWTYLRPYLISPKNEKEARLFAPDQDVDRRIYLFHRPEMIKTFRNLPNIRPNVL